MTRTPSSCDWVRSGVTEELLADFFESGMLPKKEEIHWRVPGSEKRPEPKEGEVIIFTDHILRGFRPPGSKFFRDVLHFFHIHPQDIGPNSVTNICQFQVLNEVYMQEEPSVDLFYEYHYANRQTEMAAGPALELGGITIQRRRDLPYPSATLPSHPKDWNKTWFYCQDTSPEGENPLPGYRPTRLSFASDNPLPDRMTAAERAKYASAFTKVKALLSNGLTGVDLTRCWVSWKIMPLSRRDRLMCEYTGEPNDPLCFKTTPLTDEDINSCVKGLLGESQQACNTVGLAPFCIKNPAPDADSPFWKKKFTAPVRKPKTKTPAKKKKKAATPEPVESDNSEEETEASHANAPEQQHNLRRQTRSAGSADLAAGLTHSPVQRKRPAEASPPSSGDSTASKLPPMKINPEAQAKRRKTGGSTAAPAAKEPVFAKPATPPPAANIMKDTPQPPEPAGHDTTAESPARDDLQPPSPSMADEDTALPDVAITGTGHRTPEPHVLTRHSGKAEASSLEEFNVEPSVLEKFSAEELHAGFLNRLESSRRMELKLVNLMKKRYEDALQTAESEVTSLKKNLEAQQAARSEAETKWRVAVEDLEKTQVEFALFKKNTETQQAALTKRAEDAEGRLTTVSTELQTLKRHISRMTSAVFGERSRQLSSDSLMKLKAVYSLAEQLYCGTLCTIKAMLSQQSVPKTMKGVIELLSTLPEQVKELKKSAARQGAMAALSRCLAFAPELTSDEMMDGFPSKKDDGSEFTETDYAHCRRASRVLASTLADELDLGVYQAAYSEPTKRIRGPTFEARNLNPTRRKHLFAPEIDPSPMFEDAHFEALTHCNWDVDNLQIQEVEDPEQDNPPSS